MPNVDVGSLSKSPGELANVDPKVLGATADCLASLILFGFVVRDTQNRFSKPGSQLLHLELLGQHLLTPLDSY